MSLTKPIYVEEYVFLTPAAGPYAQRRKITWKEAAQAPLCLLTPDMQNRRIIDGIFRSVDAQPKPSVETNSIFNLCSHASSGLWSSIVPRQLLQFFGIPRQTCAVELVEPSARRTIGLIMSEPRAGLAAGAQPVRDRPARRYRPADRASDIAGTTDAKFDRDLSYHPVGSFNLKYSAILNDLVEITLNWPVGGALIGRFG